MRNWCQQANLRNHPRAIVGFEGAQPIPYITDMVTDLEPDFATAEQLEACAKAKREGVALWIWNDDYFENVLLWMEIWAEAKEEMMKKNPTYASSLAKKKVGEPLLTRPFRKTFSA